jgi:predicted transcriptional regulator
MDQYSINTLNSGQILQKKTRSILDELAHLPVSRDRENLVESRASHVIQGAINLINYIKENYDEEQSAELERRLLNSIRAQDPAKFNRGVRRFKDDS